MTGRFGGDCHGEAPAISSSVAMRRIEIALGDRELASADALTQERAQLFESRFADRSVDTGAARARLHGE